MLLNWDEYLKVLDYHFSQPEEEKVWAPAVDLREIDGRYILQADLPGVKEKDIQIAFKDGTLIIKGRRKRQDTEETSLNHVMERYYGNFERIMQFPKGIDADKLKQEYKDGILTLTMPAADVKKNVA